MDVSIMIEGQDGLTWDRWKKIVKAVEDLGFAGLFRSDHFTNANPPDKESLELWVSLTYLADHTERIRFGQLVSPVSFRHPIFLARQANALNDLSGGRMILGMGAGWQEREHTMFGFELGDVPTRMNRLSEALEVASRLLAGGEPVDFEGRFYNLKSAALLPAPVERPLLNIGGNGPQRTLPLVARYAQVWNGNYLTPEDFKARSSRLDELLKENGRGPEEVKRTMMIGYYPQIDDVRPNLLSGSPEKAAGQLQKFKEAGLQEVMVQWFDHDDIEGLKSFAAAVL
ncbi:MAG: TIGR03560 family F420-dependent LLM class oxidoreductase [Actinobacteria bacterium]|nr:TIGR03560 family F420-dependent LLM class oxidoreductase [Actinomycetota bacterium]